MQIVNIWKQNADIVFGSKRDEVRVEWRILLIDDCNVFTRVLA
jgi:hypothetical protein